MAAGKATAVPGSVDFTQYAASKGVTVFYVTNRTEAENVTRKNMQALGFPMGNTDTFLMNNEKPDWTSKKKGTRRAFIAQNYRVLLLVGDNYGDFSDDFNVSEADRTASMQKNMAHIGHDWIFIANPEYGSFEQAPFLADFSKSADQRRQIKKIDDLPTWSGSAQAPEAGFSSGGVALSAAPRRGSTNSAMRRP